MDGYRSYLQNSKKKTIKEKVVKDNPIKKDWWG